MTPPERILLIRPSALGDVCRTAPVLASLRSAYPDARIDWLVRDAFADAVSAHPALTSVVPFERSRLGRTARKGNLGPSIGFLRSLRARGYDLAIDAQGLFRSGLFARATGARRRIGYANAAEMGWLFLNERVPVDATAHTVDRMLALLAPLDVEPVIDMRLWTPPEAERAIDCRYAVLAPTSRWASKRWPIDRFEALADRLLDGEVDRLVIVGGPGEESQCAPLCARAASDPRIVDRVGRTSVGDLMALIERAALVVANDSAALHMAVGFDRPTVALFGPTHVSLVGPYGRERDVIQHVGVDDDLNHKDDAQVALMERIRVEEVAAACVERLAAPASAS